MNIDPWLQRWLPFIRERTGGSALLELGCGQGDDTATLIAAGHHVIAIDLSAHAIAEARSRMPAAEYYCRDIRDPFPAQAAELGVVVASLSLHYFTWPETIGLVAQIRNTLRPGGILLCRLNSTNDHHYGASGHPRIADHYYAVHGEAKRFFNQDSINALFGKGWRTLAAEEMIIFRYAHPKMVWEVLLERDA